MLYSKQISIAANTSEENASKSRFKINKGVMTNVWISFPAGCAGLAKLRVYHEGHPFLPVNADNYLHGDNYTFVFPVMYEITNEPMIITVEAWNEDTVYSHTVDIMFLILPKAVVLPTGATEGIMESIKSLILRPIIIKEESRSEI